MHWVPLVYDAVALVLILYFTLKSMRTGLVASLITAVGYLVAVALALMGGKLLASAVFSMFLKQPLITGIDQKVGQIVDVGSLQTSIDQAMHGVPKFLTDLFSNNELTAADIASNIGDNVLSGTKTLGQAIVVDYLQPIICIVLQIILSAVLFGVFMLVVRSLSRMARGIRNVPLLGPVNRLLGGCLGLIQGLMIVYLLSVVASFVLSIHPAGYTYLNHDIMQQTHLLKRFFQFDLTSFFATYAHALLG